MYIGKNKISIRKIVCFSIFSISLIFTSNSFSAIYKWTDENGKIHYGSQKPISNKAQKLNIKIRKPTPPSSSLSGENGEQGDTANKADANTPMVKQEPQLSRLEKKRLCKQAKADVTHIKAKARFKIKGKNGKVRYLTDKEVKQRLKSSIQDVKELCGR